MNASASAGSHCHGYWFVNAANRRTSSSLGEALEFKAWDGDDVSIPVPGVSA